MNKKNTENVLNHAKICSFNSNSRFLALLGVAKHKEDPAN